MKIILIPALAIVLFSCTKSKETNTSKLNNLQKEWLNNQEQPHKIANKINSLNEDKFKEFYNLLNFRLQLSEDIENAANETNESLGYEAVRMSY